MKVKGSWPGLLVLRQGWARADARPWNDDILDASLRVRRGGARFLIASTDYLLGVHTHAVLSPPLPPASDASWRRAGFDDHLELDLYRRDLPGPVDAPEHDVRVRRDPPWTELVELDRAAFDTLWRMGELGLKEAYRAVPLSALLTVEAADEEVLGYAIVGSGVGLGYLQRIAVHPQMRRRGYGRSLLRASLRWVRSRGGRAMLLNTQQDNEDAATLYSAEGFQRDPDPLRVLRRLGG